MPEITDTDFGDRDGPCIVEYRDFTWNGHPVIRGHSCLGCRHLEMKDASAYCAHPAFLKAYEVPQYLGGNYQHRDKVLCHSLSCPALRLRGQAEHLSQPPRDEIRRGPQSRYRPEEIERMFTIPQRLPYWLEEAYAERDPAEIEVQAVPVSRYNPAYA